MSKKILLVEDEKHIARFVELELKHEGYDVFVAFDGREGLELASSDHFDVLLLDVMLPGINGIEICRRIRTQSKVPIILLTARDAVMDRVAGLDAGADDYIVKPFAIEELLARIRTILRRITPDEKNGESLHFSDIEIDVAAYEVIVQGKRLDLTKTEYDLLKLLIEHKNKVCTRELILTSVWGYDTDIETNVVDVYIRHLRNKLPGDMNAYIETVRGVGYVMRE
ncbi:response regulator transcription factor [Lysinibacillus sp. CTST325]